MWNYEKRLQYPVNIKQTNPKIAQVIMSQYGGPDGELGDTFHSVIRCLIVRLQEF